MAYIGQNLDRFSNVEKLDAITPATATGAGPYNLTKGGVAFTPSSADTMVISINGVVQYGNFTVSSSTVTFSGALADADTCDFIYHMGTGLLSTPVDNSVSTAKIVDSNITTAKINNSAVTNDKLAGSIANAKLSNSAITINGSAVSLGGSVTVGETKPTITSSSFTIAPSVSSTITIAGTNFISVPIVEAISSTGVITRASAVTFTSATSINATFTLANGSYFLRVENNDGNAVRTSSAILSVSSAPSWTTSAGSLGSFSAGSTISGLNVVATSDSNVTITEVTSPLTLTGNSDTPATTMNLTLSGSAGTTATYTISGTAPSPTSDTNYSFTLRATDVESQTADRTFSITISVGANNSGQFN